MRRTEEEDVDAEEIAPEPCRKIYVSISSSSFLNLVIRPSTPSFFYVYSKKVEANSITSRFI